MDSEAIQCLEYTYFAVNPSLLLDLVGVLRSSYDLLPITIFYIKQPIFVPLQLKRPACTGIIWLQKNS